MYYIPCSLHLFTCFHLSSLPFYCIPCEFIGLNSSNHVYYFRIFMSINHEFGFGICSACGHSTWPCSDEELDTGKCQLVFHMSLFLLIIFSFFRDRIFGPVHASRQFWRRWSLPQLWCFFVCFFGGNFFTRYVFIFHIDRPLSFSSL